METTKTREELESELLDARINANSDYNDGWTQASYRQKVIQLEAKLKSIGKQLTFDFPK
jgi:predicted nucleic-acid-binding protein